MKKTLFILVLTIICAFGSTAQASFQDVQDGSSYQEAVNYLELEGALDSGDNFRPDELATRAAFFKMLFKVFNEDISAVDGETSFEDVPTDSWFAPYAALAEDYKLVEGTLFEPAKNLRRIEALNFLMQAYGLSAPIIPISERTKLFTDVNTIHPYYSLLSRAADEGLITTDTTDRFLPYEKITRGELAQMIYTFELWQTDSLTASTEATADFYKSDIFNDIWNRILTDMYLPAGTQVDQEALFQIAVKSILESLNDPYTKYFDQSEATEFMDMLDDTFEGIGAVLIQDDATMNIFITELLDDSPAAKSGLKVGDQITAVDGISTEGMPVENVINRIKGPENTTVKITILRDETSYTYKITRTTLTVQIVTGEIYNKNSWLIDIDSFGNNIMDGLVTTLDELTAEEPDPEAIIIDLRGNPGGYINMANFVAGAFVPYLTPLVTLDYGGPKETIYNGDTGMYHGIPLYVLVDEYSASASEILAMTLREADDAVIIGKQTFGKGSAQEVITYWDGSMLKMTIARWLSSAGNSIQGVGVTPDVVITGTSETEDLWLLELNKLLD